MRERPAGCHYSCLPPFPCRLCQCSQRLFPSFAAKKPEFLFSLFVYLFIILSGRPHGIHPRASEDKHYLHTNTLFNSGVKCRDSQGKSLIRLKTCCLTEVGLGKFEFPGLAAQCYFLFLPEILFGFLMTLGTFNSLG